MSARGLGALAVVAALLAVPPIAGAAVNGWSGANEPGGEPDAATISGSSGYLGFDLGGTGGGLYRTTNGGASWSRLPGLYTGVLGVAVDESAGGVVYTATRNGIHRSFDHGKTWAEIAGTGTGTGGFFNGVAVDAGRPGTVFFTRWSSEGGGVWRSTNYGSGFWASVGSGIPTLPFLNGIVVDPFTHIAWGYQDGTGVFMLPDGGTTWQAVGGDTSVQGIAVDTGASRVIEVGPAGAASFPSNGVGAWQPINGGLTSTYLITLTTDAAGVAFATDLNGNVQRLASGATTWTPVSGGLPGGYGPKIVGDSSVAGHELALSAPGIFRANAGQGALWRTTDSGLHWRRSAAGVTGVVLHDVAASPLVAGEVLAATNGDAVQRSTNGGASWSSGRSGLPAALVQGVAFDTKTAGIAYATVFDSGIYRSTNGGASWTQLTAGGAPVGASGVRTDPYRRGTVYVTYGNAVWRSQDSGKTWELLPAFVSGYFSVGSIVPDPAAPGAIFAVGYTGIYHLGLGAATWTASATGLEGVGVEGLSVDPRSKSRWLAATGGGVYRSTDGGHTWRPATNGIGESSINDVLYDPTAANVAYASTSAGVYRTINGGSTWAPLTGGLALPQVFHLAFDADGHTLYGATQSIGAVERTRGVAPGGTAKLHGKAKVGKSLSLTVSVTGFPVPKVSISWQRCNASGGGCKKISGARAKKYKLKAGDRGHRLRAVVTASNAVGKTAIRTNSTKLVG